MNGTIRYTIRPYDTIWMLAQVFNTTVDSIMELNPGIEPRNLMIGQVVTIRPGYQYYPSYNDNGNYDMEMDQEMEDLYDYFRMLWEQHAMWTRMAVMGMVHELPETEQMMRRLLRNPVDLANALMPFLGEEAAQSFADLLTEHIKIAQEVVQAVKAGDNNAMEDADKKWHENADKIAELLGAVNSYWNTEDWRAMLYEYLELLTDNIMDMAAGNYEESINGYDDIEMLVLEMADMMAEGIGLEYMDM